MLTQIFYLYKIVDRSDPNLRLPYDILVNDFEQYIENTLMKSPWKDGTIYPNQGDLKEIKIARNRRDQRQSCKFHNNCCFSVEFFFSLF